MPISILVSLLLTVALGAPQPAAASTIDQLVREIDGTFLSEKGQRIDFKGVQLHIPAETFFTDTTVTLTNLGRVPKNSKHRRALNRNYQSSRLIYQYEIDPVGTSATDNDIIVRISYRNEDVRKRFFYRRDSSQPWQKLTTTQLYGLAQSQVVLPSLSGQLVLARHKSRREHPLKKTTYRRYTGVPYSDTAAVLDVRSGKFLYREEATKQRSIASITKLATSLVFLEEDVDMNGIASYSAAYEREGVRAPLVHGDRVELRDVLMGTLIGSTNNMAVMLSYNTALSPENFVIQMNNRAQELNLKKTKFVEPTGLNSDNVSTAGNLAKLANTAFQKYPEIYNEAGARDRYSFTTQKGRGVTIPTTNKFDGRGLYDVEAFKTGYLPGSAGRTLILQVKERASGNRIIVVLLGNPTYNTIFQEAYTLVDWTFKNWAFETF